NQSGSKVGEIELNDSIFGIEPNKKILFEAIIMQRASSRQGSHKVKTRSEVRGGGRKPWRQKGTGRARQGSIRAPHWRGGGTVFGPTPRSYGYKLPKKVRRLAVKSALSTKVGEENVTVLETLTFDAPKTKEFVEVLKNLSIEDKVLVVLDTIDKNVALSARNIPGVTVIGAKDINSLDLIAHDQIIFTKAAIEKVEEVLG